MKYLIIGTGGTGGCIGGYLACSGCDVTFAAKGSHAKAIREKGMTVHSSRKGLIKLEKVKVVEEAHISERYDVIFVCVKGYSLPDVVSAARRASHKNTIVIPILNSLSAAESLAETLPGSIVLGGCVYMSAYLLAPGEVRQGIKRFLVVFGNRENTNVPQTVLSEIRDALLHAGIDCFVSSHIDRDTFQKFSFTSPYAAAGAYYSVPASDMQREGKSRDLFMALQNELMQVAKAIDLQFEVDLIEENVKILDDLSPDTTASLQKDLELKKESEVRELIYDVLRIAEQHQIETPNYLRMAEHFRALKPR